MVRIKDIAQQLGVSSTTVSNVIHGKSNKASPELVAKIKETLEREHYVPNMAGVLLAQSDSKIIAIVLSNNIRYGDKMLQDPFIREMLAGLEESIREKGYFTMLHNTKDISDVARIAAMWNIAGTVLFGFSKEDCETLRKRTDTPMVTIDGYFETDIDNYVNVGVDDFDGGYQVGKYLVDMGHKNALYIIDNHNGCNKYRLAGFKKAMVEAGNHFDESNSPLIGANEFEQKQFFENMCNEIINGTNIYTALFFASDVYAIGAINYFQDKGINVPEQISIVGFDDTAYATVVRPYLTTVKQDILLKSVVITNTLMNIINKYDIPSKDLKLPVELIERKSVKKLEIQ